MSGNNVMQRYVPDSALQALAEAMANATREEPTEEQLHDADERVRSLLREGAL